MQHTLVPKLRFREYQDTGPWTAETLGELADPIIERVGDSDCVPFTVTTGEGLVSQEEKYGRIIAGKSLSNYYRLQRDDFAFNKSATKLFPQGYIARLQRDERAAVPNSIFTCFRIVDENVDTSFLDYMFQGNLHGRWLRHYITVGARAHGALNISDDDLYAMPVPLPEGARSLGEQRKIADCLGSLEDLIAAEGRKLEALRDHKKGLMQQLFPHEGETQPRLRFPEFRDVSTWRRRTISDILVKASSPVAVDLDTMYREIGVRSHGNGVFHKDPVSGETIGSKRVFQVVENALVLNIVFAWEQAVATTSQKEAGMIASHRFPMYIPQSEACDVRFVKLAFLTPQGKQLLGVASPGGAGRNRTLGQGEFEKLELLLPDRSEQTKIASSFLAIDNLIEAQAGKLDALRTHKRGLMQQLFPSSEETEA